MRIHLARLLVFALAWLVTPGLTEATENLWHLLQAGHGAHAQAQGADHAPEDAEHGCSGTFHLCSCHSAPAPALTAGLPRLGELDDAEGVRRSSAQHLSDPHRSPPDRPPQARELHPRARATAEVGARRT